MNISSTFSWSFLFVVVCLATMIAGCSDTISSNDADISQNNQTRIGQKVKFRHLVTIQSDDDEDDEDDDEEEEEEDERDDDDDDNNGHPAQGSQFSTQLLIGAIDPQLTADRLLKRYELMTGYRLLKRYDGYNEVIYGLVGEFSDEVYDEILDEDEFEYEISEILDELEYDEDVVWVEPDILLSEPTATTGYEVFEGQVSPWNIERVGRTTGNLNNVDVYLLDSGVHTNDLNVIEELDFVGEFASNAGIEHGYHVASILGAVDNARGVVGVAPGARLHSFRVLDNRGETRTSVVVSALDEVISRKNSNPSQPMVVNLSFGANTGTSSYNILDETVEAAVAAGIVVIVSAGNEGINVDTVTPAHVAEAITVGAFDSSDSFSSFSNYGPLVDILAPGTAVLSSVGVKGSGAIKLSSRSGTSMAAPHVAGAAVAYLQANPAATPAQVRDALRNTASVTVNSVPSGTTNLSVRVN